MAQSPGRCFGSVAIGTSRYDASEKEYMTATPPTFRPHPVEWTRERASRFWDHLASNAAENDYFSRQVGLDLISFVRTRGVSLAGRVLDFGCGPGLFLERLVEQRIEC